MHYIDLSVQELVAMVGSAIAVLLSAMINKAKTLKTRKKRYLQ